MKEANKRTKMKNTYCDLLLLIIIIMIITMFEGLESQNQCLSSLQNAPWKFKSPGAGPIFCRLNFRKLTAAISNNSY